jgi:hypothetical protein
MGFYVIAADERLPDFALLASALTAAFSLDRPTAAVQARHCWGILGKDLEEAAAGALIEKCGTFGIKTLKLPAGVIPKLSAPQQIKKIVFDQDHLAWLGAAGEAGTVRAQDILALSAAPVKEETIRIVKTKEGPSGTEKAVRFAVMSVTGLPIGMGKTKEIIKEVKGNELSFCLDILLRPDNFRLRLTHADFDFSCLKEKKTYSSQTNFRLLALELAAFAPGALKNACLWAMRENKPLTALPYDTMEDFETETRRLSALGKR